MSILSQIPHTRTIHQTVEGFVHAWQDEDFKKSLKYVQKTWKDSADKTPAHLETILSKHTPGDLISIIIVKEEEMMADARVKMQLEKGQSVLQMRLIRERRPFQPDKHGVWGVNPASIRKA